MRFHVLTALLCLAPAVCLANTDAGSSRTHKSRISTFDEAGFAVLSSSNGAFDEAGFASLARMRASDVLAALGKRAAVLAEDGDKAAARAIIEQLKVTAPIRSREEVCTTLASAAQRHNLPTSFFINLIWQESRFNPKAVSPVGAQGVAQFMPRTAEEWGLENPFDPIKAIPAAARFLASLFQEFGNLGLAAAAYNGGAGRVGSWLAKKGKLPEETRNYVKTITGRPAEQWKDAKHSEAAFKVPPSAPCRRHVPTHEVELARKKIIPLPPQKAVTVADADKSKESKDKLKKVTALAAAGKSKDQPLKARADEPPSKKAAKTRIAGDARKSSVGVKTARAEADKKTKGNRPTEMSARRNNNKVRMADGARTGASSKRR
jgi:hypothetical protein